MPMTSIRSLDTTITAIPLAGEVIDDLVDLGLGPDIDAPGRLIEQQHFHRHRQPAAQNGLLLITAGQVHDFLAALRAYDFQRLDLLVALLFSQRREQPAKARVTSTGADIDVFRHTRQRNDAFLLAIFRAQQHATAMALRGERTAAFAHTVPDARRYCVTTR